MTKTIICVVAGILFACNLYLGYKYKQMENAASIIADKYSAISVKEERISNKLKTYTLIQQAMENTEVPPIAVKNISKESFMLSDLDTSSSAPTLCFRFKETHCDACIQHAIRMLNECTATIPNRIIVLSGYSNFTHFAAFESSQNQNISTYNIEEIPCWEVDGIEQSYFFILHQGRIHNLFIPLKEDNNYTDNYIHTLLHKYWEGDSCTENHSSTELH